MNLPPCALTLWRTLSYKIKAAFLGWTNSFGKEERKLQINVFLPIKFSILTSVSPSQRGDELKASVTLGNDLSRLQIQTDERKKKSWHQWKLGHASAQETHVKTSMCAARASRAAGCRWVSAGDKMSYTWSGRKLEADWYVFTGCTKRNSSHVLMKGRQ